MQKRQITAKQTIVISFLVDFLDAALSLIAAIFSGSVIMLSQVLEAVADLVSSGFLLIGINKSKQVADRKHPFGYGRELYFWTLMAALVMLGITSTFSIYFGWQRILKPEVIKNLSLAYLVLIITLVTNAYALFLSLKRLLARHHPLQIVRIFFRSSLVETKTTLILDLMGTAASILGVISLIVYQLTGDSKVDGAGAILIGILLGLFALILVRGAKDLLVGMTASPETETKIRQSALSLPRVREVLDLRTMHIGSEKLLVNMEVHLDKKLTTREIEELIDQIKDKIRTEVPTVRHIQVELEAPDPKG